MTFAFLVECGHLEPMSESRREARMSEKLPYDWKELAGRAVRNACVPKGRRQAERWVCVRDAFCCGSTLARMLCQAFDVDPDEVRKR